MDKRGLLKEVQNLAAQRILTKDEVTAAFDAGTESGGAELEITHQRGISRILYYIGGAVIFTGISVLIGQHWSMLNNVTKILCTLGSGVAAYFAALFLDRDERLETVSGAFYFISALVMPLGLYVTFRVAGFDVGSYGIQSVVSFILLLTFFLSYLADRKTVFTIFNIIFGTWLFFGFASFLVGGNPNFDWQFPVYLVLCAGLTYMLFGYHFVGTPHRALTNVLYGFGVFGFLGAALALGKYNPQQNIFWELVFPGLVFGVMFLSVYLKSAIFLTFGSLYLMAYIFKLTSEYFAHSLGWPLALVLVGLGLIAIGYLHFNLKKKYLL